MPRYIIERSASSMTRAELAYVSDTDGKIYCEYDAPTPRRSGSTRVVPAFGSIESSK
jgi:hypothetical protein